jgi:hypothetical protein
VHESEESQARDSRTASTYATAPPSCTRGAARARISTPLDPVWQTHPKPRSRAANMGMGNSAKSARNRPGSPLDGKTVRWGGGA